MASQRQDSIISVNGSVSVRSSVSSTQLSASRAGAGGDGDGSRQGLRWIAEETARVIGENGRLFWCLSTTLILPLCCMLISNHLVSGPLVNKIFMYVDDDAVEISRTPALGPLLAKFIAYLLLVLAFSLLSTAAIVYSVACLYTGRTVDYGKVVGVVPAVWKRLLLTFIWSFMMIACYYVFFILCVDMAARWLNNNCDNDMVYWFVLLLLSLPFGILQIYITCIWHLASVVSVLEDGCFGAAAIRRSFNLIKGKLFDAFFLFNLYLALAGSIDVVFRFFVLLPYYGIFARVVAGAVLVVGLSAVTLLGMVSQTVFYFQCKSFHKEHIDLAALSGHLGSYTGELYVPLMNGNLEMEQL